MGVSDRDYMRKSSGDEKRVENYEDAVRKREYGDWGSRRRNTIKKIALWVIAVLALLMCYSLYAATL
jgi:hypothetical protein